MSMFTLHIHNVLVLTVLNMDGWFTTNENVLQRQLDYVSFIITTTGIIMLPLQEKSVPSRDHGSVVRGDFTSTGVFFVPICSSL
jgi:hypothetical protein